MECLLNDGNEHVGGHGTPNFRLELVLAVAQNCLIHLKNNSTCQRLLYKAAMVKGGKAVLLVDKTKVFGFRNLCYRYGAIAPDSLEHFSVRSTQWPDRR